MICFEGGVDLMEFVFVFCFLEMIERMILILRCDYDARVFFDRFGVLV